jgi:pyridoxal phosphate enzyme (YggS family)
MNNLKTHLVTILKNINNAANQFKRAPNSVQLLAVSKTQSSSAIRKLWQFGQKAFGENYLQEALPKIVDLKDTDIEWHFIGPIQNNKTRHIAENFSWVHSVDNEKTAFRLNNQRPEFLPALNICIQVNIDQEMSKSGVNVSEVIALVQNIINMPRLKLRGLMIIPEVSTDENKQRETFRKLHELLNDINESYSNVNGKLNLSLDTLSMGMSSDYILAIGEGATIVRVGTALFGRRASLT